MGGIHDLVVRLTNPSSKSGPLASDECRCLIWCLEAVAKPNCGW